MGYLFISFSAVRTFFPSIFFTLLLNFSGSGRIAAFPLPRQVADTLNPALREAEQYLELSRFDRAQHLLDSLYERLAKGDELSDSQALRVRLRLARVYERTNRLDQATTELLTLLDDSRAAGESAITAEALLLLALIYEEAGQPKYCQRYLRKARNLIGEAEIDYLRSRLEIRTASYHRLYGDPYRALLFARRALSYATEHDQTNAYTTAHCLLSLLYRDSDLDKSEYHLQEAARRYLSQYNPVEYVVVMLNLANVQFRYGRLEESLATNDSILTVLGTADQPAGLTAYVGPAYYNRAEALRALGRYDSAFHYMERGREEELAYLKAATDVRVLEIEAQHNREKNEQLIRQQEQRLAFTDRRNKLVTSLMAVALVALGLLLYSYIRKRRVNRQLAVALREQRLLQSEVHHRVRNNLQIVISLLDLQREETQDAPQQRNLESLAGRVHSMAAIHETLYQDGTADAVDMQQYAEKLCHYFNQLYRGGGAVRFEAQIQERLLNLETAVPLGMILNELLTNSFKYGRTDSTALQISISVRPQGKALELVYRDNGPGYPEGSLPDRQGGLGGYLLQGMSRQLNGRIITYNDEGAVAVVTFSRKTNASVILSEDTTTATTLRS